MKLLDTSIMEHISKALLFIPMIRKSWTDSSGVLRVREPYIYEHVFSGLILMSIARGIISLANGGVIWLWATWIMFFLLHVVAKEMIIDPLYYKKTFNWPNVIERVFGCLIALVVFL